MLQGQKATFTDPSAREELVRLRSAGYSYDQLALYFHVDVSTVWYHVKKCGLPTMNKATRNGMVALLKDGKAVSDVAKIYGVTEPMVISNCALAGVKGYKPKQCGIKLVLQLPHWVRERRATFKKAPVEPKREGWLWVDGEWVCAGKSINKIVQEKKEREALEREKKKLLMLMY